MRNDMALFFLNICRNKKKKKNWRKFFSL